MEQILLSHGSGGRKTHELIRDLFFKNFGNPILNKSSDAAILETMQGHLAFSTDSFVIDPIFFKGGDIGKLSICGTVNDLSVVAAVPHYLSLSFIIEEGFPLSDLEKIVESIKKETLFANVSIVTGDTKVVNRGKCDKIFINTTGIGTIPASLTHISEGAMVVPGDKIIISGSIGDHGMAIMAERESLQFKSSLQSDCASLCHMIRNALKASSGIKFMRDPTRGGLSTVLCELVEGKEFGINLQETAIPIKEEVRGLCEILGFDPLYVANEGKVVFVVSSADAGKVINALKHDVFGQEAAVIGEVVADHPGKVVLETEIGGRRIVDMPAGEQLPRIC
jgi:hydrogenase expression/formation protein HypE